MKPLGSELRELASEPMELAPKKTQHAGWTERDLARMTPEAREDYERFILSDRPKYIPMKPEKLAKLSPEDRQEYEKIFKNNKNT